MEKNRAFEEMMIPARRRLKNKDLEEMARKTACCFDLKKSVLFINTLGEEVQVETGSWETTPKLEEWHTLLLLHYLDMGDGAPCLPQLISFGELKDGMIRGTKFDHAAEKELEGLLKGRDPEEVETALKKLGASLEESRADLTAVIPFFPNYPVTINIWFEDEEFLPSGKMLLNKNADHYLTVEDAVTVGEVILNRLKKALCQKGGITA